MMDKKDFFIAVAIAIVVPLGAYAAEGSASGSSSTQQTFNQLDTNHDGSISPQEAQADTKLNDNWSRADANQDGQISESEFSAFEASIGETPSTEPPVNVQPD